MFWTSYTYLGVSFGRVFWYFPEPDNEQCLARRSAGRVAEWQSGRVAEWRYSALAAGAQRTTASLKGL
jgi:hypothetical protein